MGAVAVARTRPCGTRKRQANQADADASGATGGGAGRVARSHGWQIVPIDFTSESAVDASLPHLDGVLHKVTDLLTAGDDVSHAALQRVAVSGASARPPVAVRRRGRSDSRLVAWRRLGVGCLARDARVAPPSAPESSGG